MRSGPLLAFVVVVLTGSAASAGALSCTSFLHNRDGSWRSFNEADVEGPDGIVHLKQGEVLRPGDRSAKGDIARGLDDMCGG